MQEAKLLAMVVSINAGTCSHSRWRVVSVKTGACPHSQWNMAVKCFSTRSMSWLQSAYNTCLAVRSLKCDTTQVWKALHAFIMNLRGSSNQKSTHNALCYCSNQELSWTGGIKGDELLWSIILIKHQHEQIVLFSCVFYKIFSRLCPEQQDSALLHWRTEERVSHIWEFLCENRICWQVHLRFQYQR